MKFKPFDNIWITIVALVMGFILWLHVATEKIYNHQLQLPITEINLKPDLSLLGIPPESLTVVVSATGKQLLRSRWRRNGIRINATKYQAGRHIMSLTTDNSFLAGGENLVALDEIVRPISIPLNIDFKLEKSLKVVPDIAAVADDGFAVASISEAFPAEIIISGPRALVKAIESVSTEHLDLPGLRNSMSFTLALVPPEGFGIKIEPESVTVSVDVVPVKTRTFEAVKIISYNFPSEGLVSFSPVVVEIELTGPPKEIDRLSFNSLVASVDYNQLLPDNRIPLKVECPSRFTVKRQSVDKVSVKSQ